MRYYLIIDSNPKSIKAIQDAFVDLECYACLGVAVCFSSALNKTLKFTPHLVIFNFDTMMGNPFKTIELLNKTFGIIPKYIALTTCYKQAYKAYKHGFVDVIDKPESAKKIARSMKRYHTSHFTSNFFCIHYYYDYQYIKLSDIVLLKADNYTTDFHLKNGSKINSFDTLKRTHLQLPENFQRIHRSFVVNAFYVRRIDYGKRQLYLRHFESPLQFSKTYKCNLQHIKRILVSPYTPPLVKT